MASEEVRGSFCRDDSCVITDQLATGPGALERELLYRSNPIQASGLGWPLHALGDAANPHHVVATTSWGHRPYEDFVQKHWLQLFPSSSSDLLENPVYDPAQLHRIVEQGFYFWQGLNADPDIRKYVVGLAVQTRAQVRSQNDWAYNDSLSIQYELDGQEEAKAGYQGHEDRMRPLLEHGISAMVGLLMKAAEIARNPGLTPTTICPAGSQYDIFSLKCASVLYTCEEPKLVPIRTIRSTVVETCVQQVGVCGLDGKKCCSGFDCYGNVCTIPPR